MKITFPALHKDFYQSVDNWLKKYPRESKKAVYIVKSKTQVQRILETDEEGRLYVGEASDFTFRVGKLVNAMNGTEQGQHHAGDVYFRLISKAYGINDISIEVIFTIDHQQVEKEILQQYLNQFGELPPLNRGE